MQRIDRNVTFSPAKIIFYDEDRRFYELVVDKSEHTAFAIVVELETPICHTELT